MSVYRKKTVGAALAAVLLVGGATACENDKKDDSGKAAPGAPAQPSAPGAGGSAIEALTAAYKKTSAAKSAKVRMTMSMPASLGGSGSTVEMTGVQGWDPQVMDITVKGALTPGSGAESMRMIMSNDVMFMEMPADSPMSAGLDGKRWMKLDIKAAAEASGDAEALKKLGGVGGMDQSQDPAKQLALLLSSPNVKHLGAEKADGTDTEHYKGTLTLAEMLAANESAKALPEADRTKLVDAMKKSGIVDYDMDVWVDKDGYPVHMKVGVRMPQGTMNMDAHYSDYGSAATVQAPPENETLDLFAMLKQLGDTGAGA